MCVISINIEGFSQDKAEVLSQLCRTTHCDLLCVQETYRDASQSRPYIPGLSLIAEISDPKHGNAVFAAPGVSISFVQSSSTNCVTREEFMVAADSAVRVAQYWANDILIVLAIDTKEDEVSSAL